MLNDNTFSAWPWHKTEARSQNLPRLHDESMYKFHFWLPMSAPTTKTKEKTFLRRKKGEHDVKQEQNALNSIPRAREPAMGDLKAVLRVIISEKLCFFVHFTSLLQRFFSVPDYCLTCKTTRLKFVQRIACGFTRRHEAFHIPNWLKIQIVWKFYKSK